MSGELPCVQFFYREGRPLRVITLPDETWFSATDVINQMGHNVDEAKASALLTALGMECCVIPCADGAKKLSLPCITESSLKRMFGKMERFAAKPDRTA
jgi:prophage antirepressor-like protein